MILTFTSLVVFVRPVRADGVNFSVPDAPRKSAPSSADPGAVAQCTVTRWSDGWSSVTGKDATRVSALSPSTTVVDPMRTNVSVTTV